MSDAEPKDLSLAGRVRVMQIIKFALIQGVLVFGAVAFFLAREPADGPNMTVVWAAAGFGLAMLVTRFMLPAVLVRQRLRQLASVPSVSTNSPQSEPLIVLYQTQMIVGSAILEAAAFASLVAYLLNSQLLSLLMAGLLCAGMAFDFPTVVGVDRWIADRLRQLAEERQLTRA